MGDGALHSALASHTGLTGAMHAAEGESPSAG